MFVALMSSIILAGCNRLSSPKSKNYWDEHDGMKNDVKKIKIYPNLRKSI